MGFGLETVDLRDARQIRQGTPEFVGFEPVGKTRAIGGEHRIVGRALIEYVYAAAAEAGLSRVYWQTHEANPARKLYDRMATLTPFRRYVQELQ